VKRNRLKSSQNDGDSKAKWLTTFNDLMTLLMVFFVLLFSLGKTDTKQLRSFQNALQSGLGIMREGEKTKIAVIDPRRDFGTASETEIEESFAELNDEPGVGVVSTKEGAVITLANTILFRSGISKITPGAVPILDKIAAIIKQTSMLVRVEGHTDNDPIHTERFPSNWELSSARAVSVVKYFAGLGGVSPERFSAVGYGDSRPLFPNDSVEHKAKNRRVEIVLEIKRET
jgi:chemotaxis protein MotB